MHHILCANPFISRDFYAIRPLILWHILGSYFLLIWGVGVVEIVFRVCKIARAQRVGTHKGTGKNLLNVKRKGKVDSGCLQRLSGVIRANRKFE